MPCDKKTAYLISCSDHYAHRLDVTDYCLKQMGYDTVYITSDFDHFTKKKFKCEVEGCVQLYARPYKSNLSVSRIMSHRSFAKAAFEYIAKLPENPDVVVALLPPNFLAYYGAKYKRKHPNVKLIFDIFDLWPETFPSNKVKRLLSPIFNIWAKIRDKNLYAADCILTECDMFKERLGLSDEKTETIYLCNEALSTAKEQANLDDKKIELCYLGSINNIICIPTICSIINDLSKKKSVTLHIIGTGEKQQEFIDSAKAAGAQVEFYGAIYDDRRKQQIMSRCHFGLNIMKTSVCVGLTMKSVDYFRHGIPIINNIPADSEWIVKEYGVGIQVDDNCVDNILALSTEDCLKMRSNVDAVYNKLFESSVIVEKLTSTLEKVVSQK